MENKDDLLKVNVSAGEPPNLDGLGSDDSENESVDVSQVELKE